MNRLAARLLRRVPAGLVLAVVFLVGVGAQSVVPIALAASERGAARLAGSIVLAVALGLAAWSLATFRRAARSAPGQPFRGLVTAGPYRFSRNPVYLSLVLIYLGEVGIFDELWSLALLLLGLAYLNLVVIPAEERVLERRPGYEPYRAGVRRWIGTRRLRP